MDFIKEKNRIFLEDENAKIIAEIEFEEIEKGIFNIYHTFVDESLRGKGIASKLVQEAVNEIKARNGTVQATCSYAKKWLEKNRDNNK
ncbi:MAG: N-acetyltransferase [Clostridia bacterium]|nr:N-acetyltransferase [Clostridia bacterium]